jgi:hypothetical protein
MCVAQQCHESRNHPGNVLFLDEPSKFVGQRIPLLVVDLGDGMRGFVFPGAKLQQFFGLSSLVLQQSLDRQVRGINS